MSVKRVVLGLMATTRGTDDEFSTGVVASEPSCHCQFSTISLFWVERKESHAAAAAAAADTDLMKTKIHWTQRA